ncbi:pirin family protein [Argonema antarcticum]|uniref:pirin family protein n=1 Tax=Argonema antarcticum TaxID=2942763 RepID=UPI002010EE52|nr:pirin family protein [Argonema antarcticum]MCL1474102.1 pirin family protein [Argonema antarcticum A004/B2]
MKNILHKANERPHFDIGWIQYYSSFDSESEAPLKDPFGKLISIYDCIIPSGGQGSGMHPHEDMEVISVVLSGVLSHQDSKGNYGKIPAGGLQVMSAGCGIMHAEFNDLAEQTCEILQINILPKQNNLTPTYQNKVFSKPDITTNHITTMVSPDGSNRSLKINQDAYISYGLLEAGTSANYQVKLAANGIYLFLIDGNIEVAGENLSKRDAIAIKNVQEINIKSKEKAKILILEVPID